MITNMKTVAVYLSDQQEALNFYTETLGFEVQRNQPMGAQGNWIEVSPSGAQSHVVIYPKSMMEDWEQRNPSIVFGCDDIEGTYKELIQRGVNFTRTPTKMAWGTFAMFVDLDGNEFVITEGA